METVTKVAIPRLEEVIASFIRSGINGNLNTTTLIECGFILLDRFFYKKWN